MPLLTIGEVLHGYCGGYLGDSYEDKRVEAVGIDWVVARDDHGICYFAWDDDNRGEAWHDEIRRMSEDNQTLD